MRRVSRNVVILGMTSLLTDISSEMVTAVLPLYVVFALGASPLAFGAIDAINQGGSALVRLVAGFTADRSGRHKQVAATGYGLSTVSRLGLLLAGGATGAISAAVFVDRVGKGIRTAPRDALISLSTRPEELGTAFGVHRAMDTAGAMIGPLLAFALLALVPGAFDAVFVVSLCFGLLGVGVIVAFAENRSGTPEGSNASEVGVTLRGGIGLLRIAAVRRLLIAGSALALVTVSDAFVYLTLQRRFDFDIQYFPLLFVGSALAYMVLAIPAGRIADRFGRVRVFLIGHLLLVLLYVILLSPSLGVPAVFAVLALLGAFYAATDGVLMAQASAVLPEALRASGLAIVVTGTTIARLCASLIFGATWTAFGLHTAVLVFTAALGVAIATAALVLGRTSQGAHATT